MSDKEKEIQERYKKLAVEYAKAKAQVEVLKLAVVEEQKRSESQANTIKNFEKQLRKSNQEIESLNFRNQQLVKRIGSLQIDLQVPQPHSYSLTNHSCNNNGSASGTNNNLSSSSSLSLSSSSDEFLDKKLLENAELSALISEQRIELHKNRKQIEKFEYDLERERKSRAEDEKKLRETLRETLEQSARVTHKKELDRIRTENEDVQSKANSYWNEVLTLETRLKFELDRSSGRAGGCGGDSDNEVIDSVLKR